MLANHQFACKQGLGRPGLMEPTGDVAHLGALREPVLALATAARVCGHWMRQDEPDIGEVRALVAQMIEAADRAVAMVKR